MKVTILGCGNWGSVFGILLSRKGHQVTIWEFDSVRAQRVNQTRNNEPFLIGVPIPQNIYITSRLDEAMNGAEICVFALPSTVLRSVVEQMAPIRKPPLFYLSLIKGIEAKTLMRMSEIIESKLVKDSSQIAVLSGPCIANEVILQKPTSVVIASKEESTARIIQENIATDYFRIYYSDDIIGVELGGALKNVIAIACGISDGLNLGANARGALITRGIVEITRLGLKMGASAATFAGLSGVGDLITTATSPHSRNRHLGEKIGQGKNLQEALKDMVMVAEGVNTTIAACQLAERNNVEMPITFIIYEILFK
ncbi:MAG: NAD(P)H-dependent glycerol-3-phosphate dehydrogenase, partial [candidate division WOR-3 bacterium]